MELQEVEEGKGGRAASAEAAVTSTVVQQEVLHFDSKPLNGLRGLAALHILIFHSLWYTEYRIHIYGNVRNCFYHRPSSPNNPIYFRFKCPCFFFCLDFL